MTELDVYIAKLFEEMVFLVNENGTRVIQYPSRTATLDNILMGLPRCEHFEKSLARKAKKSIDNHTVYQVTLSDGNSFAVFCNNSSTFIGFGVHEER